MARSLAAGRRVKLAHVGLFADGVAVKQVGKETFRLVRQYVDDIVLVDTDAICAALKDVFEDTRSILEPAGALAIAGVEGVGRAASDEGPHVRRDRLRRQHELRPAALRRRARGAGRAARGDPRGDDPGAPGQLPRVLRAARQALGHRVQLPLRRSRASRTSSSASRSRTAARPSSCSPSSGAAGSRRYDLSDNEMAKLHVRHLVGGHAPSADERDPLPLRVSRAPGALMKFLNSMSRGWNISLFHYRNHGADYGRVLVGMQVPPSDKARVPRFPRPPGLRLRRGNRQSGVPDVSRPLAPRPASPGAGAAALERRRAGDGATPKGRECPCASAGRSENLLRRRKIRVIRVADADSGKVYALGNCRTPWQTCPRPVVAHNLLTCRRRDSRRGEACCRSRTRCRASR